MNHSPFTIHHSRVSNPIICALDTQDVAKATALAQAVRPHVGAVKLGLEFFTANGAAGVRAITQLGVPVFLDLKFHDIPNTVAKAVEAATALDVFMMTIHCSGSTAMMQAAAEAATRTAKALNKPRPLIIGVTLLTSLDATDVTALGYSNTLPDQVVRFARLAKQSELDGVVCSPHEITAIRHACGADFKLIVPGIRPEGADAGDQKRTLTPKQALTNGADYLVIGRPITSATNPADAAHAIAASLQ